MPKITVLPNAELCPEGAVIDAKYGQSICDALLHAGIEIEHACEHSCACSTCHVVVREGYESLNDPDEDEEDMLDRAWGLQATSRLSCQAVLSKADVTLEIHRSSPNLAKAAATKKA